jgi:hypothetical protein
MSDFLAVVGGDPESGFSLLKAPYTMRRVEGWKVGLPWGMFACLEDLIERGKNCVTHEKLTLAWVGIW